MMVTETRRCSPHRWRMALLSMMIFRYYADTHGHTYWSPHQSPRDFTFSRPSYFLLLILARRRSFSPSFNENIDYMIYIRDKFQLRVLFHGGISAPTFAATHFHFFVLPRKFHYFLRRHHDRKMALLIGCLSTASFVAVMRAFWCLHKVTSQFDEISLFVWPNARIL